VICAGFFRFLSARLATNKVWQLDDYFALMYAERMKRGYKTGGESDEDKVS
jgi:hypothetical protein